MIDPWLIQSCKRLVANGNGPLGPASDGELLF
jgi:hypothetical protein